MKWLLRKLPFLAAFAAFIAAFIWLDQDKQFRRDSFKPYSLHNTSNEGCSLAFRYLRQHANDSSSNGELNRLIELSGIESRAVVFRLGPQVIPGEHEDRKAFHAKENENENDKENDKENEKWKGKGKDQKKSVKKIPVVDSKRALLTPGEKNWVEGGGRLVLALDGVYGPLESQRLVSSVPLRKVFPIWPGIERIDAAGSRMLSGAPLEDAHALLTLSADVYAARFAIGAGDVLVFAGADIFSNAYIADAGHLQLLDALAEQRPVYFDEYVHNLQSAPGLFELLNRWGFGMALVSLAGLCLCAAWRARVPVGSPEDPYRETRSQAVDFVGSLAPLYDKALSPRQALAAHYKNFLQTAAAQSGLSGEALAAKIHTLFSSIYGFSAHDETAFTSREALGHAEFLRLLRLLNEAHGRLEKIAHSR